MKTQKSPHARFFLIALASALLPLLASGRSSLEPRPNQSDTASSQLVQNFLKASGGAAGHEQIRNVVATGTIKISTLDRRFRLVETSDGRRHITYQWTHLGRPHKVVYAHDGVLTWKQEYLPKKKHPLQVGGSEGRHFGEVLWLLQPVTLPRKADFTFEYRGDSKVKGRPVHLVKGFGKNNRPMFLYFDKENFLITRWGGIGSIAGVDEYMDFQATRFRRVDGLIFPSEIEMVAEDDVYGRIVFETIETNQNLDDLSFFMPHSTIPMLRQRPVSRD
jgi:hypothetical protein